jgi:hypothetical protein
MKKWNTKSFILLISFFASIFALSAAAFAIASNSTTYIDIDNEDELLSINDNLEGNYRLQSDIDLSKKWTPIGSKTKPFKGLLFGNGHQIRNISFNSQTPTSGDFSYFGFFGYNSGTVLSTYFSFADSDVTNLDSLGGSGAVFGPIAAVNEGYITSCSWGGTSSSFLFSGTGVTVGGFAGINRGQIKKCKTNCGLVTEGLFGTSFLGGIAGKSEDGAIYELIDSFVSVQCHSQAADSVVLYCGGFSGSCSGSVLVKNCCGEAQNFSFPNVYSNLYFGGFFGYSSGSSITVQQSCSYPTVWSTPSNGYLGGLIGFASSDSKIALTSVYSDGKYFSKCYFGGAVIASDLQISSNNLFFTSEPISLGNSFVYGNKIKESEASLSRVGLDTTYWNSNSQGKPTPDF